MKKGWLTMLADFKLGVGFDSTLKGAQLKATKLLLTGKADFFLDDFYKPDEEIMAIHTDIDSFMDRTRIGVYETYQEIIELYLSISRFIEKKGGLAYYLGGDNILAFTSVCEIECLRNLVKNGIKMGVGIAKSPREALSLASKSLERIRLGEQTEKGIKILSSH